MHGLPCQQIRRRRWRVQLFGMPGHNHDRIRSTLHTDGAGDVQVRQGLLLEQRRLRLLPCGLVLRGEQLLDLARVSCRAVPGRLLIVGRSGIMHGLRCQHLRCRRWLVDVLSLWHLQRRLADKVHGLLGHGEHSLRLQRCVSPALDRAGRVFVRLLPARLEIFNSSVQVGRPNGRRRLRLLRSRHLRLKPHH